MHCVKISVQITSCIKNWLFPSNQISTRKNDRANHKCLHAIWYWQSAMYRKPSSSHWNENDNDLYAKSFCHQEEWVDSGKCISHEINPPCSMDVYRCEIEGMYNNTHVFISLLFQFFSAFGRTVLVFVAFCTKLVRLVLLRLLTLFSS